MRDSHTFDSWTYIRAVMIIPSLRVASPQTKLMGSFNTQRFLPFANTPHRKIANNLKQREGFVWVSAGRVLSRIAFGMAGSYYGGEMSRTQSGWLSFGERIDFYSRCRLP